MGLWTVSMLVAAELLRVLRVLSSSTVVASAQALVVLALVSNHHISPGPAERRTNFLPAFVFSIKPEPASG